MSFLTPQAELDHADYKRQQRASWYIGNPSKKLRGHLFDFCVDILGYDALSESFHKPMLDAWDRLELRRQRMFLGLIPFDDAPLDRLDLWPRGHIKTWCERASILRSYLWDPVATTVTWWHAVEDKSTESGEAIAEYLLKNLKLRALFPAGVLPAMNRKKFFTNGSFRLNCQRIGDAPSLSCMGAGGESTGAHSLIGVGDDFVGWNDVVDSQMQKKKEFYRATVCNVVTRTNRIRGWKDFIGTHWAVDDPYADWRESPDWICTVRACLETEGKPDPAGEPVYLSREQIEKERRTQGSLMFAYQMMNDATASGEKPWVAVECERACTREEAKGPGWVVALSDPAPRAIGSIGGKDEKPYKDGLKNWWASGIVKLSMKGELRRIILLDAVQSKDWSLDEGMEQLVKLAMRWHANEIYCESTSTPVYLERLIRAKKDLGAKGYVIGSRRLTIGDQGDRLEQTYNANAKVNYMAALCSRANDGEFVVCDSVPSSMKVELFSQARGFMPLPGGRTGIRFDDLLNMVSFATDPYFRGKYPAVSEEYTWSPYKNEDEEPSVHGSRYVQW